MPVMDGFKATKYIKGMIKEKQIENINIIAITADFIDQKLKDKCVKFEFDELICKPVRKHVLVDVLRRYY